MGFGRDGARQSFEGRLSEAHAGNATPQRFSGALEDDACHWKRD
jgi:hypothetical protein